MKITRKQKLFNETLSKIEFKLTILKNAIVVLFGISILLIVCLILLTFAYIN